MQTHKPARWFRMYAEFLFDPKVQMLSETDQRRYIMILCARCSNGDVTLHDSEVAFQLRISEDEWCASKASLMSKGLITNDNNPTNWDKRQYASDSSAERVSKHRALQKQACNVTCNGDETKSNALEKEKEKEKESKPTDSRFARFWMAYPKKVGRGAAEKAWLKAGINGEIEQVMSAIESQKQSDQWIKDGGQYIPNPATWINQKRWLDEAVQVHPQRRGFVC